MGKKTRTYGNDGTIHQDGEVNVEIYKGKVVAVWFRCQPLPFTQSDWGKDRAREMERMYAEGNIPELTAVEVVDS